MAILNIAVSGLRSADLVIQTISNNIANAKTSGFKRSMALTSDLIYNNIRKPGGSDNNNKVPIGTQIGAGSKVVGTSRDIRQGEVINTNMPFDVMIKGLGYFAIGLPNGIRAFTRAGQFQVDPDTRRLVTSKGLPLDANGDLIIPDDLDISKITISSDGTVTGVDAQNNEVDIGQLTLFNFANENGLEATGDNLFISTEASGDEIEVADLTDKFLQGSYEGSNVEAVVELTDLITAQRWYELNAKVVSAADEMGKTIINAN